MRKVLLYLDSSGFGLGRIRMPLDHPANSPPHSRAKTTRPRSMPTTSTPAPQPNDQPPATRANTNDTRPILVCFGDCLTAGYGTDPGQSYPDYLQADLDQLGYHYHVVNQGVSGNTTKDGVERLPDILALHPAVVVVEFGGNDGLRGLPIADTRANLDIIFSELKDSGAKVVLAGITLPPDYGPDYIRSSTTPIPCSQQVPRPHAAFPAQGRLRRPRHDAARPHPRHRQRQPDRRPQLLPLVLPFLKK